MKIALVGSRVGYIDRGFESFTRNLFEQVKGELDITLFKGAGTSCPGEVVVPAFRIEKGILSKLGFSFRLREKLQERSFALGMLPWLIRNQYDAIHFSEVMLGRALLHLRRVFGFKYKLIFSNGAPAPPQFYSCFDHCQEVNGVRYDDARAFGISEEDLSLIPYGIDCLRFAPPAADERLQLRKKYNVPVDKKVVICVAAIKKHHKRIDFLIEEFAKLDDSEAFLVVVGHRTEETPSLEKEAEARLAGRYRFLTLPHEEVHESYKMADLFVLPSLTEGLPIVVLEAMACGLPVVVHNDQLYRWALGGDPGTLDMGKSGQLARRISVLLRDDLEREKLAAILHKQAVDRFDWENLVGDYLALYRDVGKSESKRFKGGETQ